MADFALKNNFFEFNGKVKRQKSGTAIGIKFAPPYPCISMDEVETEFLKSQELQPFLWLRYIDDIFMWTHREEKLTQFLNGLNNFHSNLKFTYETSSCTVNFLDLNVSVSNGAIDTDLSIKLTDGHQYLYYQSSHPLHIKNSIPYSQELRVSRICSSEKDFKTHVFHMKEWFLARGYPDIVVNNQIDKVVFGRDQPLKKNLESGISFVTTYHPEVKELGKMIRDLLPFLYSDGEAQKFFSPPPIVSYRSARKIKYFTVRSKLYSVERKVGCSGCGSSTSCICKSISITEEFTSFATKKTYKINHSFDCNDKCLIYLLRCKSCGKQYVGNTTNHFRSRWNNYKSDVGKAQKVVTWKM